MTISLKETPRTAIRGVSLWCPHGHHLILCLGIVYHMPSAFTSVTSKKHPILHRAVCFIVLAITSVMRYIFDEGDCLSPSITRYKCTVCGADKVQDDLFSAGPGQPGTHIWETGKVEKFDEATFDVIEVEVTQCVRCNAYKE